MCAKLDGSPRTSRIWVFISRPPWAEVSREQDRLRNFIWEPSVGRRAMLTSLPRNYVCTVRWRCPSDFSRLGVLERVENLIASLSVGNATVRAFQQHDLSGGRHGTRGAVLSDLGTNVRPHRACVDAGSGRGCPRHDITSWETPLGSIMPRTKSKNHRRTVVSNDPTTKATAVTRPDDARSVSQLLRLLEAQLDKHIDDIRYVSRSEEHTSELQSP